MGVSLLTWRKLIFAGVFRSRGRGLVCIPQSVVYHVGAATLKKRKSAENNI